MRSNEISQEEQLRKIILFLPDKDGFDFYLNLSKVVSFLDNNQFFTKFKHELFKYDNEICKKRNRLVKINAQATDQMADLNNRHEKIKNILNALRVLKEHEKFFRTDERESFLKRNLNVDDSKSVVLVLCRYFLRYLKNIDKNNRIYKILNEKEDGLEYKELEHLLLSNSKKSVKIEPIKNESLTLNVVNNGTGNFFSDISASNLKQTSSTRAGSTKKRWWENSFIQAIAIICTVLGVILGVISIYK